MITNWTKEELNTYLLIYCANADFTESKDEISIIKSKIPTSVFEKVHHEFNKDNDYQSIQKIQSSLETLGFTNDLKNRLLFEIKELFLSDDNYDILEKNLMRGLNRIFK